MSVFETLSKAFTFPEIDPRTSNWFLVSGPGPLFILSASYIYFSVSLGPKYMKNRKPYDLNVVLFAYNLMQVSLSVYMVAEGLGAGWLHYNLCEPVDRSNNPKAIRMTRVVYVYFLSRIIELLDTVFFVLRKKQQQITFLHVYHHTMMPFTAWIGVRYVPGGQYTFLGLLNSFVHIFMYAYYMLASLGPHMQKYLWWKKYLTVAQIVQFLIIIIHSFLISMKGCHYFPIGYHIAYMINGILFIYLFSSFYVQCYIQKPRMEQKDKQRQLTNGHSDNKNKSE